MDIRFDGKRALVTGAGKGNKRLMIIIKPILRYTSSKCFLFEFCSEFRRIKQNLILLKA